MLIAGLDLAAEPKGSALATIDFGITKARLNSLQVGVDDQIILDTAPTIDKLGIDCALGWPIEFTNFLQAHKIGGSDSASFDGGMNFRRALAYRETDRATREVIGRWPLSVSTDRLGMTAIRCAGLLSKLSARNHNVSRAGEGLVVEVYPAASMRIWGLRSAGYRNSKDTRRALLQELNDLAPWFDTTEYGELMIESCDAFDSVFAALAARAVSLGASTPAPAAHFERAKIEGWMHLPTVSITELGPRSPDSVTARKQH